MPIARMTKVSILAPRDKREELVDRLHLMGAVHVNDIVTAAGEDEELRELVDIFEPQTRELRLALAKSDFIIELLERFENTKSGLISGLIKGRTHFAYEEYARVEKELDLEAMYTELEELDVELRHTESAISEGKDELKVLAPWKGLDCPLGAADELPGVELRPVIVGSGVLDAWNEDLESRCPFSDWVEVRREGERTYVMVLVHAGSLEEFDILASEHGLEQVQLEGKKGSVEEEMTLLEDRLAEGEERKEDIEEKIKEKLPVKPMVMALNDFHYNQLIKEEIKGDFVHTASTVTLEGWVEESRAEEVGEELRGLGESIDLDFTPPQEEDAPPTLLVNRRRIRPGETLIQLFGMPDHAESDPTPFVAVFFILFFGMCIGDVGYGLILTSLLWLAIRKLDISDAAKKFLRLFLYSSIAAMVVGVFTRGYFGIEGQYLPSFMKFPGSTDILYEPIPIMVICLALGLIHISIGVAIEMHDNMRHNSIWLGICEQGTTLLSWFGIAVTAVGFGMGVNAVGMTGLLILAVGVAGIIFLSNISSKSIAGKFFGGLYNLYGLFASTIGDVASYLRLYALGLATVAVALVINKMAGQVSGIPVLGILMVIIILLGGHLFNLAISFLSAFVHPLRLQYVEFFSKFYEDGGELFAPFALDTRKTVIDDR